jgi:hypothetical protein
MVVEVNYKTKKDAADPHAKVFRTEFFESSAMPDKDTIVKKQLIWAKTLLNKPFQSVNIMKKTPKR